MAARKQYLLRIDPTLWAEVERWAADDLRSINGQIEYLLRDAVRRRRGGDTAREAPPREPARREHEREPERHGSAHEPARHEHEREPSPPHEPARHKSQSGKSRGKGDGRNAQAKGGSR